MTEETTPGPALERAHSASRDRLVCEARQTLRATGVFAELLGDRIELACATGAAELERVPSESLARLIAVSDAFQDGACHTLWHVEPELARNARVVAGLAREAVGRRCSTS